MLFRSVAARCSRKILWPYFHSLPSPSQGGWRRGPLRGGSGQPAHAALWRRLQAVRNSTWLRRFHGHCADGAQLVFRVMRVTLTEWVGETVPVLKNMHVSTVISMLDPFVGSNWNMGLSLAAVRRGEPVDGRVSLLIVTVWLGAEEKSSLCLVADVIHVRDYASRNVVTARNLLVTIVPKGGTAAAGAWAMIGISGLLIVAALFIGWDGYQAYQRYSKAAQPKEPLPRLMINQNA